MVVLVIVEYPMRTIHNLEDSKQKRKHLRNHLTPQEIILWSRLKGSQFGCKFRRQHGIGTYIVDFCCSERKLVVELDGYQHGEKTTERYDEVRTLYLQRLGYRVLRFWNDEINVNLEGVLQKITEALHTTLAFGHPSSSKEGR